MPNLPAPPSAEVAAEARRKLRWQKDPVAFAEDVFGHPEGGYGRAVWDRQAEVLRAIAFEKSVAITSGHKTSKSRSFGTIALWDGFCFPGARVVMTSSSDLQVNDILWREVINLCKQAAATKDIHGRTLLDSEGKPKKSYHLLGTTSDGFPIEPPSLARTGVDLPNGSDIKGFTTNEPERMAGTSGARLRYLIDEATGIDDAIFEAISGNRMGGALVAMASNPTRQNGFFYDAFHRKQRFWKQITISSLETPNVKAGKIVIPGLAGVETIEEFREEYGEDSAFFKIRILGQFAAGAEDVVVPIDLIASSTALWKAATRDGAATDKEFLDETDGPLVVGVDPARYGGDDSAIVAIRGTNVSRIRTVHRPGPELDDIELAGRVADFARDVRRPNEKVIIRIDTTGGYGNGIHDILARLERYGSPEFDVIGVNFSEAPYEPKYRTRRDELHWNVRTRLKNGLLIPPDVKLERELAEPKYQHTLDGAKKFIEAKDELRKRLKRSPDRADALALAAWKAEAFASVAPTYQGLPQNIRLSLSVPASGF